MEAKPTDAEDHFIEISHIPSDVPCMKTVMLGLHHWQVLVIILFDQRLSQLHYSTWKIPAVSICSPWLPDIAWDWEIDWAGESVRLNTSIDDGPSLTVRVWFTDCRRQECVRICRSTAAIVCSLICHDSRVFVGAYFHHLIWSLSSNRYHSV